MIHFANIGDVSAFIAKTNKPFKGIFYILFLFRIKQNKPNSKSTLIKTNTQQITINILL